MDTGSPLTEKQKRRFVENINYAMDYLGTDTLLLSQYIKVSDETVRKWSEGLSFPNNANREKLAYIFQFKNFKYFLKPKFIFKYYMVANFEKGYFNAKEK